MCLQLWIRSDAAARAQGTGQQQQQPTDGISAATAVATGASLSLCEVVLDTRWCARGAGVFPEQLQVAAEALPAVAWSTPVLKAAAGSGWQSRTPGFFSTCHDKRQCLPGTVNVPLADLHWKRGASRRLLPTPSSALPGTAHGNGTSARRMPCRARLIRHPMQCHRGGLEACRCWWDWCAVLARPQAFMEPALHLPASSSGTMPGLPPPWHRAHNRLLGGGGGGGGVPGLMSLVGPSHLTKGKSMSTL